MKIIKPLLLFLFISAISFAISTPTALYGSDDRIDIYAVTDTKIKDQARGVAAIVLNNNLNFINNKISLNTQVYGKSQNLCLDEKFYHQPTIANCTGFLVGPDLILTAGHCFKILPCESFSFVFDYQMTSASEINLDLNSSQVYQCQEILSLENENNTDYALIKLKKPVSDRPILKLNSEKNISLNEPLVLLGFPSGLPLKADLDKKPRSINLEKNFFTTEFDAFGANSGSPVLNHQTHLVEGILVRGEYDFEWDSSTNCRRVKKCSSGTCKGEEAQILPSALIELIQSLQ